jgi:hypothetical protein
MLTFRCSLGALALALAAHAFCSTPAPAQDPGTSRPDPATELLAAARTLEAEGELQLADDLMDFVLRRYPESAAARAIRLARSAPGTRQIENGGRTELIVWSTLYGLWLGVAIPAMLSADGSEAYGLGLLVGGPVGFGAGWSATRRTPISDGRAGAITWAGNWGTWQGFGWAQVLEPGAGSCDDFGYCEDEPSTESLFGWMIAGGLAGTAGGILATRSLDISAGDAALLSLGSLWGTWYGVAVGIIGGMHDDKVMAATLVGGNLGALAGAALARSRPVSRTDARIASIIGVVGGLAGAGVDLIARPEDEKVAMAIPAVTSAIGLALGAGRVGIGSRGDRNEAGSSGGVAAQRHDWSLGGPVFTTPVRGPSGEYRTAVGITLLSARF